MMINNSGSLSRKLVFDFGWYLLVGFV